MTRTRQLNTLDAVTLSQLTSRFDALPGSVLAAGAEPLGQPSGAIAAAPKSGAGTVVLAARDPRPDLVGDHARWTVLLALAWDRDGLAANGVYGALHGVRCCGAALVTDVQPLDLTPEGPPLRWRLTRGEIPEAEWQAYRTRWLWPHKDVLVRLLQGGQST